MDETEQKPLPKQVCSIRIMFPVETDEQAIEYKKKIGDVLADISNARIEFALTTAPS
ncbi:unnamed protein product, partial [marine sediment metagenome]